jgi:hypothetical protein
MDDATDIEKLNQDLAAADVFEKPKMDLAAGDDDEAADDIEKLKMDLAEGDDDEAADDIEKLKMDLAAAEKRALASFIAMQHMRRELDILKGKEGTVAPAENESDDDEQLRTVIKYRKERDRRILAVPAQMVKCFGCGTKVSSALAHRALCDSGDRVFCKRRCAMSNFFAGEDIAVGTHATQRVNQTESYLRRFLRGTETPLVQKSKIYGLDGWKGRS